MSGDNIVAALKDLHQITAGNSTSSHRSAYTSD
jgi:hypothetical protein